MIAIFLGCLGRFIASREVMIFLPSNVDAGQRRGAGAGGDDDVLGRYFFRAFLTVIFTCAAPAIGRRPILAFHFVFAKQMPDPFAELFRDRPAAPTSFAKSIVNPEGDAMLRGVKSEFADEFAVFEQSLGRNASPVQACSAEVFFFDAEDALFELPRTDRRRIPRRTAADDDDVVLIIGGLEDAGAGADAGFVVRPVELARHAAGFAAAGAGAAVGAADALPAYFFFTSSGFSLPVAITPIG